MPRPVRSQSRESRKGGSARAWRRQGAGEAPGGVPGARARRLGGGGGGRAVHGLFQSRGCVRRKERAERGQVSLAEASAGRASPRATNANLVAHSALLG